MVWSVYIECNSELKSDLLFWLIMRFLFEFSFLFFFFHEVRYIGVVWYFDPLSSKIKDRKWKSKHNKQMEHKIDFALCIVF